MNDDSNRDRAAVVYLPFELLAKLLQLPEGARIDVFKSDICDKDVAGLRVRGAGWTGPPGSRIPVANPAVTEYLDDDGRCFKRVITWDLPQ